MRAFSVIFIVLVFTLFVEAQQTPAPPVNERANLSLDKLLAPSDSDKSEAKRQGLKVFRILPRETYDGKVDLPGDGAYYSFVTHIGVATSALTPPNYVNNSPAATVGFERPADEKNNTKSLTNLGFQLEDKRDAPPLPRLLDPHYYGFGSDIELQLKKFSVGFAGLSYGFFYDLGDISLESVSNDTPAAVFLNAYRPPTEYSKIREEQAKAMSSYAANGFEYNSKVPAVAGHTYLLRSINFNRSDLLVALQVYRQDTDGSLIVFWKKLKTFDVPVEDVKDKTK